MHARANTPTRFDVSPPLPPQKVELEVDKARQLDYRRWLFLCAVVVAAALFDGFQRFAPVSHGYRLEESRRARVAEEAFGRQLRVEIATLEAPARIERLAIDRLHMVAPGRTDAIFISLVVPPQQPPTSVVASR